MYKIRDSLFRLLVPQPWRSVEHGIKRRDIYNKLLLKAEFMNRFANKQNGTADPWVNATELRDNDDEWQRTLRVGGWSYGQEK